MDKW